MPPKRVYSEVNLWANVKFMLCQRPSAKLDILIALEVAAVLKTGECASCVLYFTRLLISRCFEQVPHSMNDNTEECGLLHLTRIRRCRGNAVS